MPNYVKAKEARKRLDVSDVTLRAWAKEGKIKFIRSSERGNRLYDVEEFIGKKEQSVEPVEEDPKPKRKCYIYCRVSSSSQKKDLERQVNFLKDKYPDHEVIKDIASGINFKRKGLNKILADTMQGLVEEVVAAHRDRLCRIAYTHFEWLFEQFGTNLVIEDQREFSPEEEFSDDLFAIIHVFSARHYGLRRKYTIKGTKEDENNNLEKTRNEIT